ncbi:unnamed protein product [Litomosoides sigmodontis]|uniref:Uncharacterized protein n=1 Tax=Litomosoides sigmodontis TaxID=42156 RepID=A0A3P6TJN4_LITSI|nr:unnamed protein product [Litomosoides sigmodontis]
MIWCGNGEGVIRSAHPALEYSHCGHHMWCIEGQCKRAVQEVAVKLRHGGWSDWTVSGRGGCATQCVPCQISGQIRVRRSIRICNSPYPNNGGSYCVGDDARGIRCQKNKCDGPTIEEFATKSCTQLRDSGDPSTTNLTGKGMQHSSNRCKIWCFLSNGLIRTAAIFPDGTPCGIDQYCVKGRCRKLSCDGRGIVEFSSHCPRRNEMEQNGSVRLAQKHVKIVMNNSINQTVERKRFMKLRLNLQVWAEWSSWSGCTASFCGQKGFRLRRSECIKGAINRKACRMFRGQRQTCYGKCTAGDFKWTEWSACSASCDFGFEQRIRTCPTCAAEDNNKVTRVCFLKKCKNRGHWSSQNFSESCSCALRYYIRLRKCSNSSCKNKKLY